MTQDQYDEFARRVAIGVQQFNSELLTAAELVRFLTQFNVHLPDDLRSLSGILDSNTGLRYPFNQ